MFLLQSVRKIEKHEQGMDFKKKCNKILNIEQIARKKSSYDLHMITSETGILSFLKYIQIKSSSPWTRKDWQNNVRTVNSYIITNRMVLKCFLHKMQILMKKKKDFCKNCWLDLGFLVVISVCVVIRGMNLQFSAKKKKKHAHALFQFYMRILEFDQTL